MMEIVIIKLERQAVPNDGPTAFLPYHNIAKILNTTFQHMLKIPTSHIFKPTARKGDTKWAYLIARFVVPTVEEPVGAKYHCEIVPLITRIWSWLTTNITHRNATSAKFAP
jgi:hypothetical protein